MTIFFAFFYFLVCKASSILSHSQFPRNPAKLRHESVKYRDYLFFSRPRRGPLRHVCGHTNHCTAIVHTFLKSPTDLDMQPWKRFAVFGQNRRNWRLRSGHPKQQNLGFGTIYPQAMFSVFDNRPPKFYSLTNQCVVYLCSGTHLQADHAVCCLRAFEDSWFIGAASTDRIAC